MSDEKQVLIEKAFTDGFITALAQLESQVLSKYAKDVLNIDSAVNFLNASPEDKLKVLRTTMQVGSLINFIEKLKHVVKDSMDENPKKEKQPANSNKLDGGVILQ